MPLDVSPDMRPSRQSLVSLIATHCPTLCMGAEVGVACGDLSYILLNAFPQLTLYMVDAWNEFPADSAYTATGDRRARLTAAEHESRYQQARDRVEFAGGRARLWRMLSTRAADLSVLHSLDFVFIDASHAYGDVKADLRAWWRVLKPGGLFCGHDYGHRKYHGVQRAVNRFMRRKQLVFSVEPGAVWWAKKPVEVTEVKA